VVVRKPRIYRSWTILRSAFSDTTASLPGAVGMYGLSLGVSRIGETLPAPVYALLSGLNAATVGIIALAAVQLADKAITDKLSRVLVFLGGVARMLYTALWYFPVLMLAAGLATLIWDFRFLHSLFRLFWRGHRMSRRDDGDAEQTPMPGNLNVSSSRVRVSSDRSLHHRSVTAPSEHDIELPALDAASVAVVERVDALADSESGRVIPSNIELKVISWKMRIFVITSFIISFATVMVVKSLLKFPSFRIFTLQGQ
jgi:chromate transport protein ChrA